VIVMVEACTICARSGVFADGGCDFVACRQCCTLAQRAQGTPCLLHGDPSETVTESVGGVSASVMRLPVAFPSRVEKLNVTSPFLVFCPHSFTNYHLRTSRGIELFEAKIDRLAISLERGVGSFQGFGRGGGKKGTKGKASPSNGGVLEGAFNFRDLHECQSILKFITQVFDDAEITTASIVRLMHPMLLRAYKLMILKKTGGVALLKKFEDVTASDELPTFLRRSTSLAKRASGASGSVALIGDHKDAKRRRVESQHHAAAADADVDSRTSGRSGGSGDSDDSQGWGRGRTPRPPLSVLAAAAAGGGASKASALKGGWTDKKDKKTKDGDHGAGAGAGASASTAVSAAGAGDSATTPPAPGGNGGAKVRARATHHTRTKSTTTGTKVAQG
jgi:hypothetical protein